MKFLKILIFIILIISIGGTIGFFYARKEILPYKYSNYINEYSKEYNVNPNLIRAIIKVESNYNPNAVSNMGANGLMQITKETGYFIASNIGLGDFNESMLYNPEINIQMGCWYVSNLQKEFNNTSAVLAAYNAGRGNVAAWLKNQNYSKNGVDLNYIPFKETTDYVKRVEFYENLYSKLYR
ncbi:MAG: lytic transglycosylase domain-containing protein [Sarcina sp.]